MSKASVYFSAQGIDGKHDVKEIKRRLDAFPGVLSVSVSDQCSCVAVDFDTTGVQQEQLQQQMEALGYRVTNSCCKNHIM